MPGHGGVVIVKYAEVGPETGRSVSLAISIINSPITTSTRCCRALLRRDIYA